VQPRTRLGFEILEGRLPVSETISLLLGAATLDGLGSDLIRNDFRPAEAPVGPRGRTARADDRSLDQLAQDLPAVPSTAPAADAGSPAIGQPAVTGTAGPAALDDLTPSSWDFPGAAPGARPNPVPRAPGGGPAGLFGEFAGAQAAPATPASPAGGAGVVPPTTAPPPPAAPSTPPAVGPASPGPAPNTLMFHGDRARTGWNQNETTLTPANVAAHLGLVWQSPKLDTVTLNGTVYQPHIYATPLYVDSVTVTAGPFAGKTVGAVVTATSTGFVYAIKAFDTAAATNIPAGTILWRTSLGQPTPTIDGGVTVGTLSTPAIDLANNRIYVTADVTDASGRNWKAFALDLGSGSVLPGWPLAMNQTTLQPLNQNGPTLFPQAGAESQRSALNLSPDGSTLYVPFGAYGDGAPGWMVAVNTGAPALASSFGGAPSMVAFANAGMWGAGGPAVDSAGDVMDTTGNSPSGSNSTPGFWGNSFLEWNPGTPLALKGTYTPWNYSQMDDNDTDLGGGSPVVIDLDPASTSTPHLAAFGGKQGNAYLVDRFNLKGSLTARQAPSTDPTTDTSLLPPGPQPQFGTRGPLNIFGPYSENSNQVDFAKSRTTPAYFKGPDGTNYVVYSGSQKTAVNSTAPAAPSVVLTKIVTSPGQPAYLAVAAQNNMLMKLPGAPEVSGNGTANEVVWVVDANVMRTDSLTAATTPHQVLYAFDALTMKPLWASAFNELNVGGKYNHPTVARGEVFVGSDRIQAFGLTADTIVDDAVQGTGANQFRYTGAGWSHVVGTQVIGSFDGTVSIDGTANDSAAFSFTGTQVKLYSSERSNRGIAGVSIDGGPETMVDMYSASDRGGALVYTSPVLAAGAHTLTVRITGTKNAASAGTIVCIDRVNVTPAAAVTTVDDAVIGTGLNQINYVGAWTHVTNTDIAGSFNGTVSNTDRANDFATIAFSGTQVKYYTSERNNRGIVAVSIDGGPEVNVDLYSPTDAGDVLVYTSPVLAAGAHTLKVRNTGTHNPASTGTRACIDRFDILS
jgi:hypothetical protein